MTIKYTKSRVKDLKFKEDDFLVFPTDYKIKLFPKSLKSFIPNSFDIFKELSNYIKANNADVPKAFFFPQMGNLKIVTVVCVSEDKLIEYNDLFNSLEYINEDNESCTIYICEEWFTEYLQNFEAFEFDIERTFVNQNCTIVIVNNQKDYDYGSEDEQPKQSNEQTIS